MRVVLEEVLGPVVTVEGFETEQEAIQLANDLYAGAVFSKDIGKAQRVANKLKLERCGLMISIHILHKRHGVDKPTMVLGRELGKES